MPTGESVLPSVELRRRELARQLEHWKLSIARLGDLDGLAPASAWAGLEHYLGVSLRQTLTDAVARLARQADALERAFPAGGSAESLDGLRARLVSLRGAYLRTETTLDFYADALSTRSAPRMGTLLRACDHIATASMGAALRPLGRQVPAALAYLDRGLGASVLKAGLRLWDGAQNPVAAIRIVRHNLLRPTALIHEAGHQVAHMLGWNGELAEALRRATLAGDGRMAELWAGTASEVAADAFAFLHTGYAAVAALHDMLDGSDASVFQFLPGDPHPISYLRVLLGLEMCRRSYGQGPWDDLRSVWLANHLLDRAPADIAPFLHASANWLPGIVETVLHRPYEAFGGRPAVAVVDPQRVSPSALASLARAAGAAAFTSPHWAWTEALRLLALSGYRAGQDDRSLRQAAIEQEGLMVRLGGLVHAA